MEQYGQDGCEDHPEESKHKYGWPQVCLVRKLLQPASEQPDDNRCGNHDSKNSVHQELFDKQGDHPERAGSVHLSDAYLFRFSLGCE
jgi:hypothetical protein